jgi:lysylphosphatidylglycerol synthetase-like protein (DUF2156 family)
MTPNRYSPPQADVALQVPRPEVPAGIAKKIKSAWVAALISCAVTFVFATVAVNSGKPFGGLDGTAFFDVVLMLGLAFGIFKRSRACAVAMFAYFVISKIIVIAETGKASGIFLALVFMYYYWQGIVGTFAYHKHVKSQ